MYTDSFMACSWANKKKLFRDVGNHLGLNTGNRYRVIQRVARRVCVIINFVNVIRDTVKGCDNILLSIL